MEVFKSTMTYSFDIFDTCLIRACGYPESVFDILAEKVLGTGCNYALYADFSAERRDGERRARHSLINDIKEDITLEDIYNYCDFSLYTNKEKAFIMQTELEIEKKMLYPVKSIYEEIKKLHNHNHRVIYISDMYLPPEFIKDILLKNGLFEDGDQLFISCEIGKTKRTGNLFKYIHDYLKLDYRKWEHLGDNIISDISIPQKYGIKTKRAHYPLSYYEKKLINKDIYINKGYLARIANLSKTIRYTLGDTPQISFAADFVAPIYIPFVYYLLNDSNQKGIRHLFFLARDAYLFYIIAKIFSHLFPQISINYIYVSRKSLYLPGLTNITEKSISNLFLTKDKPNLNDILDKLQMTDYPVKDSVKNIRDTNKCICQLLKDTDFVSQLKDKQAKQKELCLRYFNECGLTETNSAIVDLAGTRKCHEIINQLLIESGNTPVFGYYLEVLSNRVKGVHYDALYFNDRYAINERHSNPLIPQELYEQYFSITDHQRTASYTIKNHKVVPVFEEDVMNIDYKKKIFNTNRRVCSLFANIYTYMIKDYHEYICRNAIETYANFYKEPLPHYVKALEGMLFSDSACRAESVISKEPFIKSILNRRKLRWSRAQIIYNSPYPNMIFKLIHIYDTIKNSL